MKKKKNEKKEKNNKKNYLLSWVIFAEESLQIALFNLIFGDARIPSTVKIRREPLT